MSKQKEMLVLNGQGHTSAMDGLRLQLQECQAAAAEKDEENAALRSKLSTIRAQISKLERIQQGEISRSRSGSRLGAQFRFGGARGADSSLNHLASQTQNSASSLSPRHSENRAGKNSKGRRNQSKAASSIGHLRSHGSPRQKTRPNIKEKLFGSYNMKKQIEDLVKIEKHTAETMTLKEYLESRQGD